MSGWIFPSILTSSYIIIDSINEVYVLVNTPFVLKSVLQWIYGLFRCIMKSTLLCVFDSALITDSFHPTGTIQSHWFQSKNHCRSCGKVVQVCVMRFFFWSQSGFPSPFRPSLPVSIHQGHVIPFSSLFSQSLPLRDIVEVEVGTQTQQHDACQHIVDKFPEFRLQVALPVPEYQHYGGSTG